MRIVALLQKCDSLSQRYAEGGTAVSALLALHIYHSFVIAFLYSACSKCGTFGDLLAVVILLNKTAPGPCSSND